MMHQCGRLKQKRRSINICRVDGGRHGWMDMAGWTWHYGLVTTMELNIQWNRNLDIILTLNEIVWTNLRINKI